MQEPKQIRSTSGLNKVVEILLKLAIADCKVKGVTPLIVETVRTQERQYWLFGQGRTAEQLMKYHIPVKYAHKGNIVTQVTSSIHQLRCAVDVVPMRDNKAIWNANASDPTPERLLSARCTRHQRALEGYALSAFRPV